MAKGLDELIDWLVAETAYCGDTGLTVTDFVVAVNRFFDGPKPEASRDLNGSKNSTTTESGTDNALARKAWEWLVARPEIHVGRDGCRGNMTLDEALALPEPAPIDDNVDDIKTEEAIPKPTSKTATPKGGAKGKKVSFAATSTPSTPTSTPKRVSAAQRAAAAAAAANPDDPSTRPRLFATEETVWHALTGHDVDLKKVPPLEWKCLMGIALARADGILQGDLRALVNQDKRSVPKRTDFLASKGYIIKRTTIARGYRTSMLWLTEFAPAELDVEESSASASASQPDTSGLDLSPEFLRKDLDPVPWRNRWIGDAIEFASFGQTILAIIKAWGVIRVVDLKHKLGIIGQRWQMRTLARACREFVESGILRFVAAMRADERKLFKDCIKYERDPTPQEWAVYLAAGRRRGPITDIRAKHRRDQERRIRSESVLTSADQSNSVYGDLADDADFDEETFDLETSSHAMWQPGVPLLNLVYDTVERAGTAGITSPEICRLTVGTRYSRYMFSLINALSKAGSQPAHLRCFQLHCEPDRIGKNKAYLFRTLKNQRRAKEEEAMASVEGGLDNADAETSIMESRAASPAETRQTLTLHERGELENLPASELRRLFGFAAAVPLSASEATDRLHDAIAAHNQKPTFRNIGRPRTASSKPTSKNKGAFGRRRGRPPKERPVGDDGEDVYLPKRGRGRPKKISLAEAEDEAEPQIEDVEMADAGEEHADTSAGKVRLGEPNSLTPHTPGKRGRKPRSIVLIFALDQLKQPEFLAQQKGYKEGAIRELPDDYDDEEEEQSEDEEEEIEVAAVNESGNAEDVNIDEENAEETAEVPKTQPPGKLTPVQVLYHGAPGTLAVDRADKTLTFTPAPRRGRGRHKKPIVIDIVKLASAPAIRGVPGTDDKALVVEVKEDDATAWPYTFVLDEGEDEGDDDSIKVQADLLMSVLLKLYAGEDVEVEDEVEAEDEAEVVVEVEAEAEDEAEPEDTIHAEPAKRGRKTKHVGPPYICDRCNNEWKNLLGLQYHQTKSKSACNPDYVPPDPNDTPKARKEREKALRIAEREAREANKAAEDAARPRLRQRKSISFADMDANGGEESEAEVPDAESDDDKDIASDDDTTPARKANLNKPDFRRRLLGVVQDEPESGIVPSFRGITGASKVSSTPRKLQPLPPRATPRPVVETLPASSPLSTPSRLTEVSRAKVLFPAERAASASRLSTPAAASAMHDTIVALSRPQTPQTPQSPQTPLGDAPATTSAYPSPSAPSAVSTPFKSAPMPAALSVNASSSSAPGKLEPFRMPPLPRNFAKASIFILRALRTVEIIRYLVSCYDSGIFPSDRSLWYACYAIYTKAFPGQDPPTLNVTKASLKKLELAKVVEEHTFGFRDARGQFIYCRLVARPGTELFQNETAKEMKRNIQAAYPKPFVPAEFAPSDKDMAVLRVMDKEFDREMPKSSTRGRRSLAPEIEVLKAPVYGKPTPTRTASKAILVLDYNEAEDDDDDDNGVGAGRPPKKVKGTPGRKRKAGPSRAGPGEEDESDFVGALSRTNTGEGESTPVSASASAADPSSNKKRRAKFADFIAGKAEARWARRDTNSIEDGDYDDDGVEKFEDDDIDANIDPLLRDSSTMRIRNKPGPRPKVKMPVNPGLDSLPDHFFHHSTGSTESTTSTGHSQSTNTAAYRNNKNRGAHLRAVGPDGHATFVHFLPPNTSLGEDHSMELLNVDLQSEYAKVTPKRRPFPRPRMYKIVTKTFTLGDNPGTSPESSHSWPILTETILARHSDSSVTMDGWMPTAKSLVRANLPRSAAECASLLRKNHVLSGISVLAQDYSEDLTNAERMMLDIEYCRAWEHSQPGADLLNNPSVEPKYVFLNMKFAGGAQAHQICRSDDYAQAGAELWVPENQYTVDTLPYAALEEEELFGDESEKEAVMAGAETATAEPTSPASRRNAAAANAQRSRDSLAVRDRQARQARQAKYVMSSRRELTAYPQTEAEFVSSVSDNEKREWNSDETLLAAFIAVRTLLGGLGNAVDWGLMMRLFPDYKLSALRTFWSTQRKRKQVYIDKYTERFQTDFLEAYDSGALPPIDYDNVVAYDWHRLVHWTVNMIRHSAAVTLPATRAELEDKYAIVDMVASAAAAPSISASASAAAAGSVSGSAPQAISASLQQASAPAVPSWREDYFHVSRSVWNRLQDSAGEAACKPIDAAAPTTPAEAAAAMAAGRPGALDALRFMVARSWIRALCGTPHDRYKPALIKEKLLSLRSVGVAGAVEENDPAELKREEAKTNALLQIVIGNLTHARILRRSKSMVAVSGRMYQMAELYETTLEKAAMEDKFRQAWAFKQRLDSAFRRGESVELPTNANDDGMMMALVNLQAHGRVAITSVDAPHVPFGFEPGNYETRKFPKHYQRFQQRIVPVDYIYNEDVGDLKSGKFDLQTETDGAHGEKPIWRDFFGVLDRQWFTRLTSAVVFSLATRGATPAAQTAAHLRPVIEPFEVQMITAWASRVGILYGMDGSGSVDDLTERPPGSATVTEWWWLMVGQMYTAVEKKGGRTRARAVDVEVEAEPEAEAMEVDAVA